MAAVTGKWSEFFWGVYSQSLAAQLARVQTLLGLPLRNPTEEAELLGLLQCYTVGFCFGGNLMHDRVPCAFEVIFSPDQTSAPAPQPLQVGQMRYWGCPNLMDRLIFGLDRGLFAAIKNSGKWNGSDQDLFTLMQPFVLQTITLLPIREAIDWVHASVYATIKMMRYSQLDPLCGGPIEVAVITSDRHFRWVRHKAMDAAINSAGG
jgi:hypothetical protein